VNSWPFPGFSTRWFVKLWHDPAPKDAAWLSVKVALFSCAFALILGTAMAFAFARFRFFGRELVNFTVTLPIILPGVITGVALASFFLFTHTDLSVRTVVVGHTTFCIVLVFNNVLARLRRLSPSLEEASRDLGASGFQTFRNVTFPSIRTALIAGALLALALSFDEIAVTFFLAGADTTTLPLWILGAFRNSQNLPEVNAVATVVLVISLPMIATAAYLMRDEGAGSRIVAE
jgi:putative spermidine/putrescine transport system permease protein